MAWQRAPAPRRSPLAGLGHSNGGQRTRSEVAEAPGLRSAQSGVARGLDLPGCPQHSPDSGLALAGDFQGPVWPRVPCILRGSPPLLGVTFPGEVAIQVHPAPGRDLPGPGWPLRGV